MKKIIFALSCIALSVQASAQNASPICTDLPANLYRGREDNNVLKLQQFLFSKGLLKATPNGYFGPGTHAATVAYQKSKGLAAVGSAGPLTRAAIKKETCPQATTQALPSTPQPAYQASSTTVSAPAGAAAVAAQRPSIEGFDLVTLFEGGKTEWTFNMYGRNFHPTANSILFKNTMNGKTYTVGTLPSATGTMIVLPKSLTAALYPCGQGCNERLASGPYEVSVSVPGVPSSEPRGISVKPFTVSAQTGSLVYAIPAIANNALFGTLTLSSGDPVVLISAALTTSSSTISPSGITSVTLKNELAGTVFSPTIALSPYQSMIIGAYVNTQNVQPGTLYGVFTVEVEDYIGKRRTSFAATPFLVTIEGGR